MDIIDDKLSLYRDRLGVLVSSLQDLSLEINNNELTRILNELGQRLNEPFMFVIVGEVKAGKSSFINALLRTKEEICKVAPSPMTDTIQLISYGEYREEKISPTLKKIYFPEDILKEVSIVDTPGTNTIIEYHQEITEDFIPSADLVIFVFEAKNPYRQSAWDLFKYVSEEWHKKIVFVLQQKDLMSEENLQINEQGLKDHAIKNGIENPVIFSSSAKQEQEGDFEKSGFKMIRGFITDNITGGKAPYLKFSNNVATFSKLFDKISLGLDLRRAQNIADQDFRKDVELSLEEETNKSKSKINYFVENLLAGYDSATLSVANELKSSLSLLSIMKFSFSSIFNKDATLKAKMESLSNKLNLELNKSVQNQIDHGIKDISESISQVLHIVDLKIRSSKTILENDHDLYSKIADKRSMVLIELEHAFSKFMKSSESFTRGRELDGQRDFGKEVFSGGGLAILGIIVSSITQLTIFDITGGILTTAGVLFASITTGIKRRKILNDYSDIIEKGRLKLANDVENELTSFVEDIIVKINELFGDFDKLIADEKVLLENIWISKHNIEHELKELTEFANNSLA